MLKIWGRNNSVNVKKILWCAEEAKIPYENIQVGGAFGGLDSPDYLKMNPNGLIPVIEDDGLVRWESNAIVRYLAEQYAPNSLCPTDKRQKAQAEQWMDWTLSFFLPFRDLYWGLIRTSDNERNQAKIDEAFAQCCKLLETPNSVLANQDYLAGDSFSMADIPLGCFIYAWFNMPIKSPDFPHLTRWYEALTKREAYQKTVMIPLS